MKILGPINMFYIYFNTVSDLLFDALQSLILSVLN